MQLRIQIHADTNEKLEGGEYKLICCTHNADPLAIHTAAGTRTELREEGVKRAGMAATEAGRKRVNEES